MAKVTLVAAVGWALAVVAGFVVDYADVPPGGRANVGRSLFAAVDAATLTGFVRSWDSGDAGGGALTFVGVAASLVVGTGAIVRANQTDVTTPKPRATSPQVRAADLRAVSPRLWVGIIVVVVVLLAVGAKALGGGGVADASGATLWLVLFPAAAVGTLGPVLLAGDLKQRRLATTATAVAFLASLALLTACAGPSAAVLSVDARSAGFTGTSAVAELPAAGQWALVPVMLLGTAGGGAGGGLKVTTAAALLIGLWRMTRGGTVGRTFAIAGVWLLAFAMLFGVTFLALIATLPQLPADRVAVLAAGCVSNVGLSVDPVTASGADAYVMSAAMLLGRVLPWGVLWWSATRGDEGVAVG